jgi:hypothetical protein
MFDYNSPSVNRIIVIIIRAGTPAKNRTKEEKNISANFRNYSNEMLDQLKVN